MWNQRENTIWLNIFLVKDDLMRLEISPADFLSQSGLATSYTEVECTEKSEIGRPLICFQRSNVTRLTTNHCVNELDDLFRTLRQRLWVSAASVVPYRRYYVYLCPPDEEAQQLPQLLSIYAISYYLGSITRHRPHHFSTIIDSDLGPAVLDFISGQPMQYLYLIASEFAQQEISKPSMV
jgi:hypothetical protein